MAQRGRGAAAKLSLAVACAVLASSGCKVGPDFHRPASPVAEHWIGEPPGSVAEPANTADWWKLFHDATLDDLIDTAYHNNLSLQVAGARILQAQAQLNVAIGELFPQQQALAGQVQHEHQSQATLVVPGLNPDLDTSQLGLSATWELDFWGKYRRGVESDRAAMLASVAAYDNGLVSLTAGVASTYLNIRVLEQRIEVLQQNLKTQQEGLRIASAQFEAGETSQLDVEQARTQLAQTRSQLPDAGQDRADARCGGRHTGRTERGCYRNAERPAATPARCATGRADSRRTKRRHRCRQGEPVSRLLIDRQLRLRGHEPARRVGQRSVQLGQPGERLWSLPRVADLQQIGRAHV